MSVFQDWDANKANIKGRIILVCFRLAKLVRSNIVLVILFFWYLAIYKVMVEWILGVELPWGAKIGKGLSLYHGQALVVHPDVTIGENCVLRQSTTIGNKQDKDGGYHVNCPVIGNNVDIGSNVCIIGNITIGDNVKIGAGSVVIKSVPANSVVVGNPGRIISTL